MICCRYIFAVKSTYIKNILNTNRYNENLDIEYVREYEDMNDLTTEIKEKHDKYKI